MSNAQKLEQIAHYLYDNAGLKRPAAARHGFGILDDLQDSGATTIDEKTETVQEYLREEARMARGEAARHAFNIVCKLDEEDQYQTFFNSMLRMLAEREAR